MRGGFISWRCTGMRRVFTRRGKSIHPEGSVLLVPRGKVEVSLEAYALTRGIEIMEDLRT